MSELKFNTKHGDASTQKLAREILENIRVAGATKSFLESLPAAMDIDEKAPPTQFPTTPSKRRKKDKTVICEIKVTGRLLPKLVDELQQDGQFTLMEHPLVTSGMGPKPKKASSIIRWISKRANPKSAPTPPKATKI